MDYAEMSSARLGAACTCREVPQVHECVSPVETIFARDVTDAVVTYMLMQDRDRTAREANAAVWKLRRRTKAAFQSDRRLIVDTNAPSYLRETTIRWPAFNLVLDIHQTYRALFPHMEHARAGTPFSSVVYAAFQMPLEQLRLLNVTALVIAAQLSTRDFTQPGYIQNAMSDITSGIRGAPSKRRSRPSRQSLFLDESVTPEMLFSYCSALRMHGQVAPTLAALYPPNAKLARSRRAATNIDVQSAQYKTEQYGGTNAAFMRIASGFTRLVSAVLTTQSDANVHIVLADTIRTVPAHTPSASTRNVYVVLTPSDIFIVDKRAVTHYNVTGVDIDVSDALRTLQNALRILHENNDDAPVILTGITAITSSSSRTRFQVSDIEDVQRYLARRGYRVTIHANELHAFFGMLIVLCTIANTLETLPVVYIKPASRVAEYIAVCVGATLDTHRLQNRYIPVEGVSEHLTDALWSFGNNMLTDTNAIALLERMLQCAYAYDKTEILFPSLTQV